MDDEVCVKCFPSNLRQLESVQHESTIGQNSDSTVIVNLVPMVDFWLQNTHYHTLQDIGSINDNVIDNHAILCEGKSAGIANCQLANNSWCVFINFPNLDRFQHLPLVVKSFYNIWWHQITIGEKCLWFFLVISISICWSISSSRFYSWL